MLPYPVCHNMAKKKALLLLLYIYLTMFLKTAFQAVYELTTRTQPLAILKAILLLLHYSHVIRFLFSFAFKVFCLFVKYLNSIYVCTGKTLTAT